MSVKKTGSPFTSGADPIEQLDSKDGLSRSEKVDKGFEAALADAASGLDEAGGASGVEGELRSEFQRIAGGTNFDSPESEASAILQSARILVNSRLDENLEKTEQGKKAAEKLSSYITNDPFLQKKLRDILHRLR